MSKSVLYMSMSVDGYIAGPNVSPSNGLGDGGERLHEWNLSPEGGAAHKQVYEEFVATGAIVAGRGTFEPAEGWGGDHHGGVPIWVLSRRPTPEWVTGWPNVTYLNDVEMAMQAAKSAAGDKNVLVHGASTAQRAIRNGLLDELELHLIPILLGEGVPLFKHVGVQQRERERVRVLEGESGVTHLRYRILS